MESFYHLLESQLTESQQELLKDVMIHQRAYYRKKIVKLESVIRHLHYDMELIIKALRYDVNEAYENGFKAGMSEERPRP